jgi:hypothetical protein
MAGSRITGNAAGRRPPPNSNFYVAHPRWVSPDPVRGCVMNPQKFDRYGYVLDNPESLVDPQGSYGVWPVSDRRTYPHLPVQRNQDSSAQDEPPPTGGPFVWNCPAGTRKRFDTLAFIACVGLGVPVPLFTCVVGTAACLTSGNPIICLGAAIACGITLGVVAVCSFAATHCVTENPNSPGHGKRSRGGGGGRRGPYVNVPAGGDSGSLFGLDTPPGASADASAGDDVGPGSGWCPDCPPPGLTPRSGP